MDRETEIQAIQLELHGLDVELYEKRLLHKSIVEVISSLEEQRLDLLQKLIALQSQDNEQGVFRWDVC